jgi:hypothetical protein
VAEANQLAVSAADVALDADNRAVQLQIQQFPGARARYVAPP